MQKREFYSSLPSAQSFKSFSRHPRRVFDFLLYLLFPCNLIWFQWMFKRVRFTWWTNERHDKARNPEGPVFSCLNLSIPMINSGTPSVLYPPPVPDVRKLTISHSWSAISWVWPPMDKVIPHRLSISDYWIVHFRSSPVVRYDVRPALCIALEIRKLSLFVQSMKSYRLVRCLRVGTAK